ncbi:MAG: platelet-activating factor acetylhydrolase IB subunit [Nitrospirota bacterium]
MKFLHRRGPYLRCLAILLALGSPLTLPTFVQAFDRIPAAVTPVSRSESWWIAQHEHTLARIREGGVDLLMIGDSITQRWAAEGRHVWSTYYGHRRAVNLGFSGDCTEHVLWRLNHGEIDGIAPKLAVVMIGTNNIGARLDPPEETAAGIQAILSTVRTGLPDTKILLLGVFPRGASGDDPLRQVTLAINNLARTYADNKQIFFLDLSPLFLDNQGRLAQHLMPDYLHPNEQGYQVWADGMEDMLSQLLGEHQHKDKRRS